MIKDFIERRKKCNEALDERADNKTPRLSTDPNAVVVIRYNQGRGCMVVDMENLLKLPKSIQNKIFKLK